MSALSIGRYHARYHLPRTASGERQRLDKILAVVLGEALEGAVERAGVATHEEICIRRLHSLVRLRLSAADAALAASWGMALADAIERALKKGSPDTIVRYRSRAHALIDMAIGIALGDYRRAWAWEQLGFWHEGVRASDRQAVAELVHALVAEPQMIVPVLRALAEGPYFARLVPRLRAEQCIALAHAAVTTAGGPPDLELLAGDNESQWRDRPRPLRTTESRSQAALPPGAAVMLQRLLARLGVSPLARALTLSADPARDSAQVYRAFAVLAILEVDPTALRQMSQTVFTLIRRIAGAMREHGRATLREHSATDYLADDPSMNHAERTDSVYPREGTTVPAQEGVIADPQQNKGSSPSALVADAPAEVHRASDELDDRPLPNVRCRSATCYGGLLFLLGLVEDLGLHEAILEYEIVAKRGLRWCLHQLALSLVPIEPGDPAALAFAGLPPNARSPDLDCEPCTDAERDVIDEFAARLIRGLRARLVCPDLPTATLLHEVCARRAEVIADPGWIELHFGLEDLSGDIRRAGLDLDPDYLPWLGVVVRFIYE